MNYYKKYTPYLFLLPAAAVLIVFFFIPFFQTFGLSFFDYTNSIYQPTFNGLDNYAKLFREPIFYKVMFNTFMYLVIAVPFLVTSGSGYLGDRYLVTLYIFPLYALSGDW